MPLSAKSIVPNISCWAERIWPRLWLPIGIIALFIIVSTFGLWPMVPVLCTYCAAALVFALALYFSFKPVLKITRPDRHCQAIRWLEKKSGLAHRPCNRF